MLAGSNTADFEEQSGLCAEQIDILIPFTTLKETQCALTVADRLAAAGRYRMRVLRLHEVPVCLPVDSTAIPVKHLRGEFLDLKADHEFYGELQLTHDSESSWAGMVHTNCIIIIGSCRRPWKTRQERLAGHLTHMGHRVLLVYGE